MTKLLILVKIKIISLQSLHNLCSVYKFRPYLKVSHKENNAKMACYKYGFKHALLLGTTTCPQQ